MESIIVDKLDSFTSEFAIIPKEQCGFTKGKSVETNLLSCLNDWSSLVDLGKSVDVVYLAFAKAFDKVAINFLMAKLKTQGISLDDSLRGSHIFFPTVNLPLKLMQYLVTSLTF
jgi:hypothetical protein